MYTHLHKQGTVFLEPDSLSVSESEELIVVHNRVHILHPQSIHISIKQDVLPLFLLSRSIDFSEDVGQEAVGPVSCDGVQDTIQLYHSHCLGIHGVQLCTETQSEEMLYDLSLIHV